MQAVLRLWPTSFKELFCPQPPAAGGSNPDSHSLLLISIGFPDFSSNSDGSEYNKELTFFLRTQILLVVQLNMECGCLVYILF